MEGVLRGAPPGQFTGAGGGGAVQAVPPITSILAGEAEVCGHAPFWRVGCHLPSAIVCSSHRFLCRALYHESIQP